jgi:hypothetical protein
VFILVSFQIATAVLSTTAKAKARAKKSEKEKQTAEGTSESMDIVILFFI